MPGSQKEAVKMLCYSAGPNRYFDEKAAEVAELYDGFFFPIGSWDDGVSRYLEFDGSPSQNDWFSSVRNNLVSLRRAGVSENFLTVSFSADGDWPSPATLLTQEFREKMEQGFSTIGSAARELGFRGVCVDIEYPYPRYSVEHEIYDYKGYTADDLLVASRHEGRICAGAILQEFPDAVIMSLPGSIRCRPIGRMYLIGMVEEMSSRQARGGFHLGTEFSYSLHDPVTTAAIPCFPDAQMTSLLSEDVMAYWQRYCTTSPGVWPLHMVETGGEGYPVRPWREEVSELHRQMAILRSLSKRYVWSFSGNPVWYVYSDELQEKYGLPSQNLSRDIDLRDWHSVLLDKSVDVPELSELIGEVRGFHACKIGPQRLCDAFGTPARWWVLGILSNPCSNPKFAARGALKEPFDPNAAFHGRDSYVRWFTFDNFDPRGITDMRYVFDWRGTDEASAHLFSFVHSPSNLECILNVGWDDELEVRINGEVVFSQIEYGKGHGFLYRDRYCFENQAPSHFVRGKNELMVTSSNDYGAWIFSLRFTDEKGIPIQGLRFDLQ